MKRAAYSFMSQPRDNFNANVPDLTDFTSLGGGGRGGGGHFRRIVKRMIRIIILIASGALFLKSILCLF